MAYFTTVLQHQVNNVWRKRIEDAYAEMNLHASGKAIRDYLNNRQTLCTAGFVIRRHLQREMPGILEQAKMLSDCGYADLSNNLNVKWPAPFISELARLLYKISKEKKISISRTTWVSYLDDEPIKMYKNTPFKVAFALSMNIDTTEELLMACGQDTYCFRNPEHFIYYYCQSRSSFSWSHAQELIKKYQSGLNDDLYTANDASTGMTRVLRSDLKHLFSTDQDDRRSDDALIDYMLHHQKEFSGLSLTARKDLLRMARYLAILYPTYSKTTITRDRISGEVTETTEEIPVGTLPDGSPKLGDLIRALFSTGGWLPTTVGSYIDEENNKNKRTASSIKRRENSANIEYRRADVDEEQDRPFMTSVQYFVDSYAHHIDAIDRVYRRPSSPDNVERRDVILFTYFFIRRYPELLMDEEMYGKDLDRLTSLVYDDERIDVCMDYLMDELYSISVKQMDASSDSDYDKSKDTVDYIGLFNEVLKTFSMKGMYMPNPWDRFITMSLFAEDPDFFTEAVLWNTISDDPEDPSVEEEDASFAEETENLKPFSQDVSSLETALMIKYPSATPSVYDSSGKKIFLSAALLRVSNGEYIPIKKSCFIFGRLAVQSSLKQDYGFRTETRSISRNHAAILFYEKNFYLADLSSSHCTWLNRNLIKPSNLKPSVSDPVFASAAYLLRNNDRITVGDEEFIFLLPQV